MIDEVLRPYVLILNEAQVKNLNATVVFDGLISVMTAMSTEYLSKTFDPRQHVQLMGGIQAIVDDFVDSLQTSCEANFGLEIERHSAAQQAAPGTA
jgi:hypothetical protein